MNEDNGLIAESALEFSAEKYLWNTEDGPLPMDWPANTPRFTPLPANDPLVAQQAQLDRIEAMLKALITATHGASMVLAERRLVDEFNAAGGVRRSERSVADDIDDDGIAVG